MRAWLLLGALATCSPAPPVASRDPHVAIASKADFEPAQLAGRWHEIARLAIAPPCPLLDVDVSGGVLRLDETCAGTRRTRTATLVGPGRLALSDGTALWVLWIDEGGRTAILANPDGKIARILDRRPDLAEDRRRTAFDVLDFNGFPATALVPTAATAGRIAE